MGDKSPKLSSSGPRKDRQTTSCEFRLRRPSVIGPGFAQATASPANSPAPPHLRYHKDKIEARMFVVVWQFEIAEEKIAAFEAAYGPEGAWAQLFRTSPDYRGTELLRDAYISGAYLTIDRWASEDAFRAFRKDHDADYETLDRSCDALTSRETRIGAYTV